MFQASLVVVQRLIDTSPSYSSVPGFFGSGTKTDWHISSGSSAWLHIGLKGLRYRCALSFPSILRISKLMLSDPVPLPIFESLASCSISSSKILGPEGSL